jgi:hypothetical protein
MKMPMLQSSYLADAANGSSSFFSTHPIISIAGGIIGVLIVIGLITQAPGIIRYLRIKTM